MDNKEVREQALQRLMEDNFLGSRLCRKLTERLKDASLKYYFQTLASRRSQFAFEISDEIEYYGGKKPFFPTQPYDRNREEDCEEDKVKCLKKALRYFKASLLKYQEALCRICDGTCREVLLRHKAALEHNVFELKALKELLKDRSRTNRTLEEVRTHS